MDDIWNFYMENLDNNINQLRLSGIEAMILFMRMYDETDPITKIFSCLFIILFSFLLLLIIMGFILGTFCLLLFSFMAALSSIFFIYYLVLEKVFRLYRDS